MNKKFFLSTFIKDLRIALSYRLQFIFSIFSIFISIAFISIFSVLVDSSDNQYLKPYGGSYFTFLFFGFLAAETTVLLLNTMPNKVREYQLTGIFEELIMSGKREIDIIIASLLYPLAFLIFRIGCYFFAFFLISNNSEILSQISAISLFSFLLFSISLIGISLISTGVTIVFKSPAIINRSYLTLSSIFSGVAFPVEILPKQFVFIGELFPTTHFLRIFRHDAIEYSGLSIDLIYNFSALSILAMTFLLSGIYLLIKCINISKKNGNLLNY